MKKVFVLVLLTVALFACGAVSDDLNWFLIIGEYRFSGGSSYGTSPLATEDYDSGFDIVAASISSGALVLFYQYKVNGDNWSGPTGWVTVNFVSPIVPGESYTWDNIYLWCTPRWGGNGPIKITSWIPTDPRIIPPSDWSYRLYLDYVPAGIVYNGPYEWDLMDMLYSNRKYVEFPAFVSTTGLDGYRFHITVTAIPEPTTLLPLAGAAITAGVIWRRRQR